jgi:hypothetical protein
MTQPVPTIHTATAAQTAERAAAAGTQPVQSIGALTRLAQQETNPISYYRRGFKLIASALGAVYGELDLRLGANSLSECFADEGTTPVVQSLVQAMVLESQTELTSECRQYPTGPNGHTAAVMTCTVIDPLNGGCIGAIAIAVLEVDEFKAAQTLAKLQSYAGIFTALAQRVGKSNEAPVEQVQRALERAARHENIVEFAFSLVNSLAKKYKCHQVSFGIVQDDAIQIVAVSGLDRWSKRAPGIVVLEQAFGETLDFGKPIQHPVVEADEIVDVAPTMLHERWRQLAGGAVLSIPIHCGEDVVAVAGFVIEQESNWAAAERSKVFSILQSFAPVVAVLARQRKSFRQQIRHGGQYWKSRFVGLSRISRAGMVLLAISAAGVLAVGSLDHHVKVQCEVAPAVSYQLSSSIAGPIRVANAKAGDLVRRGDVLVKLDTETTELELDGILADLASAHASVDDALTRRNSRDLATSRAELAELLARKATLRRRIEDAVVRAPVDGIVLRGDVDRRIGETVSEGESLMEIAATEGRLVLLRIPEKRALEVLTGQEGKFSLEAKPFQKIDCRIRRVLPATEVHLDRNYIIAEADIGAHPEWFKVGMEGTATINTGRRRISWILFHDSWNWLRGRLWL